MQLRVFALLGLLLAAPLVAQANTISLPGGASIIELPPNSVGQAVTLVTSGQDAFSDANFVVTIGAGGPAVSAVFGDNLTAIPGVNLAGSVWANGFGGIGGTPNGTTLDSSGRDLLISFGMPGFGSFVAEGTIVALTVTTFSPGDYILDLTGTSVLNGTDEETGDPIPAPIQFGPIILRVTPEPSSIVMGLMAAAGMAAVVIRRRRTA